MKPLPPRPALPPMYEALLNLSTPIHGRKECHAAWAVMPLDAPEHAAAGQVVMDAAIRQAPWVVAWLHDKGVPLPPRMGRQPLLHWAVQEGGSRTMELMRWLDKGWLNLHERDGQRRTAVHIAASHGRIHLLRELLARGANATAMDRAGNTPLHLLARAEAEGVLSLQEGVDALREAGASINALNHQGVSAFHRLLLAHRWSRDTHAPWFGFTPESVEKERPIPEEAALRAFQGLPEPIPFMVFLYDELQVLSNLRITLSRPQVDRLMAPVHAYLDERPCLPESVLSHIDELREEVHDLYGAELAHLRAHLEEVVLGQRLATTTTAPAPRLRSRM